MPKKHQNVPPDEQSKRFVEEVQRMIDAGELDPIVAEQRFERAMTGVRQPPKAAPANSGD